MKTNTRGKKLNATQNYVIHKLQGKVKMYSKAVNDMF